MYIKMYSYFQKFLYAWTIYFKELTVKLFLEKPPAFDHLDLFTSIIYFKELTVKLFLEKPPALDNLDLFTSIIFFFI